MSAAALGLGCAPLANMYERLAEDEALATVDAAWKAGIRFFDTAPLYGLGVSEYRVGLALAQRPRDEFTIATKVGRLLVDGPDPNTIFDDVPALHPVFDFSHDGVMRSLDSSLERLGMDRVDIVHVHDPDDHLDEALAGAFPALQRLRDEKVIDAVGAGMNQSAMLTRFVREGIVDCVLIAGRYTLLDQSAADDLLPACGEAGVPVIAAGVFNSGVLAVPKPGAHFDYAPASADLVERAGAIAGVCADHGVSLRAAALQFPRRHEAVTTVLMGARTAREVEQNAADFKQPIPEELWSALQTHSK